jgi:Flp pilus assembly protein TadG
MQPRGRLRDDDSGTAAVEFALVSVVLFTILFGIVQYGMLFFERQAASSAVREATRLAAVGIDDCTTFAAEVRARAAANGLREDDVTEVHSTYTAAPPYPPGTPPHVGATVTVRMTYIPTLFDFPFVPTPSSMPVFATARVEQLGTHTGPC